MEYFVPIQGFIITQDGQVATYTSQVVGNVTDDWSELSVGANLLE